MRFVIDFGSHTVKLYDVQVGSVITTVTWAAIESTPSSEGVTRMLRALREQCGETEGICAFGTAAMRRDSDLAHLTSVAAAKAGIPFEVLSQDREAELVRAAVLQAGLAVSAVVDAGGGSIEITSTESGLEPTYLAFGISDLNRWFRLNDPDPSRRAIIPCVAHLSGHVPIVQSFAYTGGERAYLQKCGVPVRGDWCSSVDFAQCAHRMSLRSIEELEALSPFGPRWMRGAVASNCVVLSLLMRGGLDSFLPSDLSVSDGIALALAREPVRRS